MICFDSELFPQNFVWQLNNDRKSLKPHRNCQIKSSKWLYFSFHMSQRINNIQFYSYESIFPTNFKCSKHFALKKSSELWHSSSSRKGRLRIAAFQYYNSKDYAFTYFYIFFQQWWTRFYGWWASLSSSTAHESYGPKTFSGNYLIFFIKKTCCKQSKSKK